MGYSRYDPRAQGRAAWNAGKTVGTKRPLTQKQIWAIRFYLDREARLRDRALFDLAIDSKLRGCDLVKIKIGDVVGGAEIRTRAIVVQQKTGRPVQFELTADVRASLLLWLERRGGTVADFLFPSRVNHTNHMSTRQYARLVDEWGHVVFARRRGRSSPADEALAARGLSRRVSVIVPGFPAVIAVVSASDLLGLVPRSARLALPGYEIALFELPIPMPELVISQIWHPRTDADAGYRWLRAMVFEAFRKGP